MENGIMAKSFFTTTKGNQTNRTKQGGLSVYQSPPFRFSTMDSVLIYILVSPFQQPLVQQQGLQLSYT